MFRQQIRDAREEGFTLIELLIVIVVLGILAGIVVFGVSTFRADAQLAACKADLKTVSVAEDAHNAKWGFAASGVGLAGDTTATVGTTAGTLVGNGYLKTPPLAASNISMTAAGVVSSSTPNCT